MQAPARSRNGYRGYAIVGVLLLALSRLHGQSAAPGDQPLVQPGDLRYLGAFKLPDAWPAMREDRLTFRYARAGVAFNPRSTSNPLAASLFISCFGSASNVAEVTIPDPVVSASGNLADLPTASIIQHCADVEAGAATPLHFGQGGISGLLVAESKLYFTYYDSYPAGGCPTVSHFVKPSLDLDAADATGGFVVGNTAGGTCFVNGPMTWIPSEWRPLLGNRPAITYQCCHSIISTTSWGPSAFAFDPAGLGAAPVASVALQWYSSNHPGLGNWSGKGSPAAPLRFEPPWDNAWNNAPVPGYRGLVIPGGTRSALYFGAQGIGPYCYGKGTADSSLHGTPTSDGTTYCYDPTDPSGASKGDHAYPYRYQIAAYDLRDWAEVAAGRKQPYDVLPYAIWPLVSPALPFANGKTNNQSGGAAYDPSTRRIYFVHANVQNALPMVHVWEVANAAPARVGSAEAAGGMALAFSRAPGGSLSISVKNPDFGGRSAFLTIRNAKGRALKEFRLDGATRSGEITRVWDRADAPGGMYYLTLRAGPIHLRKAIALPD